MNGKLDVDAARRAPVARLVVVLAVVVAVIVAVAWGVLSVGAGAEPARPDRGGGEVVRSEGPAGQESREAAPDPGAARVGVEAGPLAAVASYAFPTGERALEVVVFDAVGALASGAEVEVRDVVDAADVAVAVERDRVWRGHADQTGLVAWPALPLGTYAVRAVTPDGHTAGRTIAVNATTGGAPQRLVLTCSTPQMVPLRISVIDDARGGIGDAQVFAVRSGAGSPFDEPLGVTDEHGELAIDIAPGTLVLRAEKGALRGSSFRLVSARDLQPRATIELAPLGSLICGVPRDYDGAMMQAALAITRGTPGGHDIQRGPMTHRARIEHGAARFAELPQGRYLLWLEHPRAAQLVAAPEVRRSPGGGSHTITWPPSPVVVSVQAGRETRIDLRVVDGLRVTGTVSWRGDGRPVVGAQLLCRPVQREPQPGTIHIESKARNGAFAATVFEQAATTAADGSYSFERLQPGVYEVAVTGTDCTRSHRWITVSADGEHVVDHLVERPGMLIGSTPVPVMLTLRPTAGGPAYTWASRGTFSIPGLPPGTYELEVAEQARGPAALVGRLGTGAADAARKRSVDVLVLAGQATMCDLADCLDRVAGTVRWRGRPLPDARVRFDGDTALCDADGRFELFTLRQGTRSLRVAWGGVEQTFPIVVGGPPVDLELPSTELIVDAVDVAGARLPCTVSFLRDGVDLASRRLQDEPCRVVGLPPGDYFVSAFFADGAQLMQQVTVEERAEVTLVLPAGAPLQVRVRDTAGASVAAAHVRVTSRADLQGATRPSPSTGRTDPDGLLRFDYVPLGAVEVVVEHRGKRVAVPHEVTPDAALRLDVTLQ
ncbi:MAG: carboxypeptidase-like regulatory domain-containing protein [Planctomycetota bacterium]